MSTPAATSESQAAATPTLELFHAIR
uniref:Uncharacterized protein n=1 Tax=Oryza punctata TaxID=4537 RepID=A0A0E0L1F9_ORYPU